LETQQGLCPCTPQGALPLDPSAGRCPAPQLGALPPTPLLRGAAPGPRSGALPPTPLLRGSAPHPSWGRCPQHPRKGHRPLTLHPEILKDFRGVLFWRSLMNLACLYWGNQGAFRSPPGPLRSAPLLTVLSKQQRKNHSSSKQANTPPSGGAPKVSKGRSESPLVAREGETPPRTKESCRFYAYTCNAPLPDEPGGFPIAPWTPSESPPMRVIRAINKGKPFSIKIPRSLWLRGNGSRGNAPCGVQGQRPCRGVGQSPTSRSPEGAALWRGCRGGAPDRGSRGHSPLVGFQRA